MPRDPKPDADRAPVPPVIDWTKARAREFAELGLRAGEQPTALCLSGGGIRSAAFSLGVIQAFAEVGLLKRFNYLSTVSGGGYIGGWLTRLIGSRNDRKPEGDKGPVSLAEIESTLTRLADGVACDEIRALRRYTNYLTPRLGPASADLWAGVLLWLRNTLINWLVFVPLLVFAVSWPIAYRGLIDVLAAVGRDGTDLTHLIAGFGAASLSAYYCVVFLSIKYLPTHRHPGREWHKTEPSEFGPTDAQVLSRVVVPAVIWCLLAPAAVAPMMGLRHAAPGPAAGPAAEAQMCPVAPLADAADGGPPQGIASRPEGRTVRTTVTGIGTGCAVVVSISPDAPRETSGQARGDAAARPLDRTETRLFLAATVLVSILAYLGGVILVLTFDYGDKPANRRLQAGLFKANAVAWVASSTVSAGVNAVGIWLGSGLDVVLFTVAGPLWALLAEILRSTVYIAFRKRALRGDLDREWLARLNGSKLSIVLSMAVVALTVLVAPIYLLPGAKSSLAVLGGGAASGTAAALLGKSAQTAFAARKPDGTRWVSTGMLISAAILIFAAALLMVTGHVVDLGVSSLACPAAIREGSAAALATACRPGVLSGALSVAVGLVALGLAVKFGNWINLNNFSMHAVYRNRLVRAFLGTARPKGDWRPDRYAHFDPVDDMRMADAFSRREPRALLHVVNVALNCTSGKDLARAERKAESFTITPFHCGSGSLDPEGKRDGTGNPRGAYADTAFYAGEEREAGPLDEEKGISLGTAITISGAAASPNMGYHSSPLIAFIMTLFNVRLGAWLPNPGARCGDRAFLRRPDADSIKPILKELAGRSDDADRYIYLSDGGHFDNLALYEMLRRRCKLMVVVDAGQDESYGYADLRIAIQNASIDLGVRMTFPDSLEIGQSALSPFGTVAAVVYPKIDGTGSQARGEEDGRILYLKPWLSKDCPTELRAFKVLRHAFPHESTGNQFFTESDFESYRSLGAYIGRKALAAYRGDDPTRRALRPGETEMDRLLSVLPR